MANDILTDETGDIVIENGDFKIGESTQREVNDIFTLDKGHIREHGALGLGMIRMINSNFNEAQIKKEADLNLKMDNKKARNLTIENGSINGDVENL